jgi:two-component system, NtrC family, nitrogen regulation response regulator GlnG
LSKTVLVADDDAAIRTVLNQALARAGYDVRTTGTASNLWKWVQSGEGDIVVTDVVMPDENAFDLLPRIRRLRPGLPVIVMSAQNTFLTAVKASERGAFEYLPKPFDLQDLISVVSRALAQPAKVDKVEMGHVEDMPLVGRSPAMQDIYRILARLMQTDLTVMIGGESGTGKELVARALHDFGKRRRGPFVAINMAAIPKDLIEAELFGHEKGAFTGAAQRGIGRFEQAEAGTLFLDEIGDMPMEAQTRLLRVLQQGEYTTVGGRELIQTDVRIVAATNKDLTALIRAGLFREDLYYRLNVVPIKLPPLRDRVVDIPDLARHFLAICEKEGLPKKFLDVEAIARLQRHSWPGNVRELENIIRRLAALTPEETITADAVDQALEASLFVAVATQPQPGRPLEPMGDMPLGALVEAHMNRLLASLGNELPSAGLYDRVLAEVESPLISAILGVTRGNQVQAAEVLGINRNTLRKKIADLNLRVYRGMK